MPNKQNISNQFKSWSQPAFFGGILFFGLAHPILNFWELPAAWMITLLLVFIPVFAAKTVFFSTRISPHLAQMSGTHIFVFLLAAALFGGFMTWRLYRLPEAYQSITITPVGEQVSLIEIKSNYQPLILEKAALKSGWRSENGFYHATPGSAPLSFSFKTVVDKPVVLLFLTSPQGGTAQVKLNSQKSQIALFNDRPGQTTLRLVSDYRGIPGWLFNSLLIFSAFFTFGSITFLLLVIQDIGQTNSPVQPVCFKAHNRNLFILAVFGFIVCLFNILTIPLTINPDSHGFLEGSLHLLKYGNLDGVSMYRGPGTTFLFAPVMYLFGNNAWGIKIFLHLFAIACLFPAYRLGWQLSGSQAVAFTAGLLIVFSPDLMAYASVVMSDVPNIFFVLTFLTLLVSALQKPERKWIFSTLLVGSFAVLLRSENLVMLAIGALSIITSGVYTWLKTNKLNIQHFFAIALALLVAALPILWWSAHNLRMHGFFGMSNYQSEVFYDGWVYYGDALGTKFSNPDSPAIQAMQEAIEDHPIEITDQKGVPTGWEIYPALLAAGYSPNQAFDLMGSAAWDAIYNNPRLAIKVLFNKYDRGLTPQMQPMITYPLPGEEAFGDILYDDYFYQKSPNLPGLIGLRRQVDEFVRASYPLLYPGWVLFVLLTVFLSFFRSPWQTWSAHTIITASRILIPLTLGVAFWRYTLAGWLPAQITAIAWLWVLAQGLRQLRLR